VNRKHKEIRKAIRKARHRNWEKHVHYACHKAWVKAGCLPANTGRTRARRARFSKEEDNALHTGILRHGTKWTRILTDDELKFHPKRTPQNLRGRHNYTRKHA
jgi:hypothetical protein